MKRNQRGYTLVELLVTMTVGSILMGITAANLRAYSRGSKNAVAMIQGFVKQARAKAISRTAAYKIYADPGGKKIRTSFANSCSSATFVTDASLVLDMPEETSLVSPSWSVCFNSRGIADSNITISFKTRDAGTKQLEVLLGGATREL